MFHCQLRFIQLNRLNFPASTTMLRVLPMNASTASTVLTPAMVTLMANSNPRGRRAEIHSSGGKMNVMGMRPILAISPCK